MSTQSSSNPPAAKHRPMLTPLMWWFMVAMVLANIAGAMSPMLMGIYLSKLGANINQVGLVFTIMGAAILLLQVFGGWISDSIGRLRAIAIGSVGGIIGFICLVLAPTWQWMIVALIVYQIPFAMVGPSSGAFIAENSTEETRGQVYGITGTIYQITGVIGPPLGGFLAQRLSTNEQISFKLMLVVAGILYTIAAVLRIWMARATQKVHPQPTKPLSVKSFGVSMKTMFAMLFAGGILTWILLSDGISDIAFRLSGELQPLFMQKIGLLTIEKIGLLGSINAIAIMFIPLLAGKISDKYGERVPLVSGFLLVSVSLFIFSVAQGFWMFALVYIIAGIGVGMLGPAYQSLISKVVPTNMLGTFQGVFYGSIGMVSLIAPWAGSQLWTRVSPQTPFLVTACAALLILPIIWFKFRLPGKPAQPGSESKPLPSPASGAPAED